MYRAAAAVTAALLLAGCTAMDAGGDRRTGPDADGDAAMTDMTLSSPAFADGERIPDRYGYTADNVNPPLDISGVPEDAVSLVLIMDDPDAEPVAGTVWDHWVLYDIPPTTAHIDEGEAPGTVGRNDYGEQGYGGPNPPDQEHTYVFTLYALDTELGLSPGATKAEVEDAIDGHVIAKDVLTGTYAP